jgi:hypothetical protein
MAPAGFRLDYNPIVITRLTSAAMIALLTPWLWAQAASPPEANDTSYVTCGGKPLTSRTVRGEVFVSPDGKRRAYAEVEATAVHPQKTPGYTGPECVNRSRLFVTGDDGQVNLVFLQEPTDIEPGNSLRVVDWSEDGRQLLFQLAQWQYDSPGVTRAPIVYDTVWRLFLQPDMGQVLDKHFGMDCASDVHVLGFLPEGKIAIETGPLTPESEEVLGVQSCSKKKSQWALTIGNENLAPLPEAAKVQHYAQTESLRK